VQPCGAGAYLTLWESEEVQRDFLAQHQTQGQVYSHWGHADGEVRLEREQLESLLARRTVFLADAARTKRSADAEHTQRSADAEHTHRSADAACARSAKCARSDGAATAVHSEGADAADGACEPAEAPGAAAEAQPQAQPGWPALLSAGMSQKELRAAAKEHNMRVLAQAGMEAVGRQDRPGTDSAEGNATQKARRSGSGTRKKLESMMRKMARS
jgi:hypothetical protein